MKKRLLFALLAFAGVLAALPVPAGSIGALSLVPPDTSIVGFVRIADLRSNPFQLRLFEETDKISADGDGARFLKEAGINLREDVDTVVACTANDGSGHGRSLVMFEGRFDTSKLSAAVAKRGASKQSVPGGDYYRLKDNSNAGSTTHQPGAVAFLSSHLVVAGSESAVVAALAARANGGTGFATGQGLGREFHRVNPGSTAWVLADMSRWRESRAASQGAEGPAAGVISALRSLTLVTIEATVEPDALALKGTGLSPDEETRELLEDALRGLTAAGRMAAQEKHPELVAAIRKFQISHDNEGVTISGSVPGDLIRQYTAEARARSGK